MTAWLTPVVLLIAAAAILGLIVGWCINALFAARAHNRLIAQSEARVRATKSRLEAATTANSRLTQDIERANDDLAKAQRRLLDEGDHRNNQVRELGELLSRKDRQRVDIERQLRALEEQQLRVQRDITQFRLFKNREVEQLREQLGLKGAAGSSSLSAGTGKAPMSAGSSGSGSTDQSLMSPGPSGSVQPVATAQGAAAQNGLTRPHEAASAGSPDHTPATPGRVAPTAAAANAASDPLGSDGVSVQRDVVNQQRASSPIGTRTGAAVGAMASARSGHSIDGLNLEGHAPLVAADTTDGSLPDITHVVIESEEDVLDMTSEFDFDPAQLLDDTAEPETLSADDLPSINLSSDQPAHTPGSAAEHVAERATPSTQEPESRGPGLLDRLRNRR